jgi:hypothetical protein
MNLKYLAAAGAASLLMAGAAYAQPTSPAPAPAYPSTGGAASTTTSTTDSSTSVSGTTSSSSGVTTSTTTTSAEVAGQNASVTTSLTTNGPVPDTAENRRKYGGPMSHAGKHTAAKGN